MEPFSILHWQAQSKPHAPLFGTPPHVFPGGQVPHLQKVHVKPLRLGSREATGAVKRSPDGPGR